GERGHAARNSCPVRRSDQQGMGAGAAKALLPCIQFRAAGRRDRQWAEYFSHGAAQLPLGRRFSFSAPCVGTGSAGTGGPGVAIIHVAVALGRGTCPGTGSLSKREESSAADSAYALR